ncbi:unnamed protein product, partial [Owenia fusiformis]
VVEAGYVAHTCSPMGTIIGVLGLLVAIAIIAVLAFFVFKLHNKIKQLNREKSLLQKDSNNRSGTSVMDVAFLQSQNVPYEEVDFQTNTYVQLKRGDVKVDI